MKNKVSAQAVSRKLKEGETRAEAVERAKVYYTLNDITIPRPVLSVTLTSCQGRVGKTRVLSLLAKAEKAKHG